MIMEPIKIIQQFLKDASGLTIKPFGDGLIHQTFVVSGQIDIPLFILQRVNHHVFRQPQDIASNLDAMSSFLKNKGILNLFPLPMKTLLDEDYAIVNHDYYRLIPFVPGTHTLNECKTPDEAFEAAYQFGHFTSSFESFDTNQLQDKD